MKTVQLEESGRLVLASTTPGINPLKGDAPVRVHRSGVCGTDIDAFNGSNPSLLIRAFPVTTSFLGA